jgi:hypothetical protein
MMQRAISTPCALRHAMRRLDDLLGFRRIDPRRRRRCGCSEKCRYLGISVSRYLGISVSRYLGISVARVKLALFVCMAFCALFAVLQVADAGSVIGAALGALIFGLVQIDIGYTSIDNNWYRVFLGGMLLVAVLSNSDIRKRVAPTRILCSLRILRLLGRITKR